MAHITYSLTLTGKTRLQVQRRCFRQFVVLQVEESGTSTLHTYQDPYTEDRVVQSRWRDATPNDLIDLKEL